MQLFVDPWQIFFLINLNLKCICRLFLGDSLTMLLGLITTKIWERSLHHRDLSQGRVFNDDLLCLPWMVSYFLCLVFNELCMRTVFDFLCDEIYNKCHLILSVLKFTISFVWFVSEETKPDVTFHYLKTNCVAEDHNIGLL